jgi:hypothetical protein
MTLNPNARPWTCEIYRLVMAGVSHRDDIIRLATPHVPQGHAYRERERVREGFKRRYARKRGGPPIKPMPELQRTPAEIHAFGARLIIRKTLGSLVSTGRIVRDGDHYRPGRPTT